MSSSATASIVNQKQSGKGYKKQSARDKREDQLHETRVRMGKHFTSNQVLGRNITIGCVAVEITQKCNLDCSLCYLSEHSQSVQDIPLQEVFRRLDEVVRYYGPGTNVQITGGDPTLRKHSELIEIVGYATRLGLHTALFTNGISATRKLLTNLAKAGLNDVAFHVDTTQGRAGYANEKSLNEIRKEYIERCKDLDLMVIFNTTLHTGNFHELPALVHFFVENAASVSFVSFQLQAETGRGEWGSRDDCIDPLTVRSGIEKVLKKSLPWETIRVGHHNCHSYMPTLVANKQVYPVVDDESLFSRFINDFAYVNTRRQDGVRRIITNYAIAILKRPVWIPRLLKAGFAKVFQMKRDIFLGKGKLYKLSFFVQNFMDAKALEQDRIEACSFMVMTAQGPVSMCKHNAHRDDYILQPIRFVDALGREEVYKPLPSSPKACASTQSACNGCNNNV